MSNYYNPLGGPQTATQQVLRNAPGPDARSAIAPRYNTPQYDSRNSPADLAANSGRWLQERAPLLATGIGRSLEKAGRGQPLSYADYGRSAAEGATMAAPAGRLASQAARPVINAGTTLANQYAKNQNQSLGLSDANRRRVEMLKRMYKTGLGSPIEDPVQTTAKMVQYGTSAPVMSFRQLEGEALNGQRP